MVLVSVTMLLVGSWSLLRRRQAGQALPDMFRPDLSQLGWTAGQTALMRIASLGLPIYAAMIIGSPMVALALSLTFAAGLPTIFDRNGNLGTIRERLGHKKASLFVLSTLIVLNVLGFDAPVDIQPLRGYIALFVSIFLLRPPFSSAREAVPATTQPKIDSLSKMTDGAAFLVNQQMSAVTTCPLIASTEDIQLTLVSGALLAVVTVLLSPFNGARLTFGATDFFSTLIMAACFAVSLTLSSPASLHTRQKMGYVAASVLVIFFSALPHSESSRLLCLTWIIVAVLSYFAAIFDDPKHGHASHAHSEAELSAVTKFLLQKGESYPLLYSILKEDDSRRIFYFMLYVDPLNSLLC
jgi:zinc transporter 5/7